MLHELESAFDSACQMVRLPAADVGYHSTVPAGHMVHHARASLDYALLLVRRGELDRAVAIVEAVLPLQVTDPTDEHFGIWPWYLEEPPHEMKPADWNWADFCGLRLAEIDHDADILPESLRHRVRDAVVMAGWSIFRRNVGPTYTNIALKGAVVTGYAGEALGQDELLRYARRRIRNMVDFNEFSEYNSPAYALISLDVCERALNLLDDASMRADWRTVHRRLWEMIAKHFHAPTMQWAGPHSRAYSDVLLTEQAEFLSRRIGLNVPAHPSVRSRLRLGVFLGPAIDCPSDLVPAFQAGRDDEWEAKLVRDLGEKAGVREHVWMRDNACLASASTETTWVQRRPLLGYFGGATERLSVLTVQLLKDDRPWASGQLSLRQQGPCIEGEVRFIPGQGDYHLMLDAPPDGEFDASDIRFRVRLAGPTPLAHESREHSFELSTRTSHVRVVIGEGNPLLHPLVAVADGDADACWVDLIFYKGEPRPWPITQMQDALGVFVIEADSTSPRISD